jgi:hypothetical protein
MNLQIYEFLEKNVFLQHFDALSETNNFSMAHVKRLVRFKAGYKFTDTAISSANKKQ